MVTAKDQQAARRIEEILRSRKSPLADQLAKVEIVLALPEHIREQIIDELGEEFSRSGVQPNGEPNDYGLEIEGLTDACITWSKDA